jgi:hypothetical protein
MPGVASSQDRFWVMCDPVDGLGEYVDGDSIGDEGDPTFIRWCETGRLEGSLHWQRVVARRVSNFAPLAIKVLQRLQVVHDRVWRDRTTRACHLPHSEPRPQLLYRRTVELCEGRVPLCGHPPQDHDQILALCEQR